MVKKCVRKKSGAEVGQKGGRSDSISHGLMMCIMFPSVFPLYGTKKLSKKGTTKVGQKWGRKGVEVGQREQKWGKGGRSVAEETKNQ